MTSNAVGNISSIKEGNIDRDRIVNRDMVIDEYFCSISQYLLWKPRSCSSCQYILYFVKKCIQTWIKNPNSAKRCPFRCEPFGDRRCPPYVQSLLSRLNIHCRNFEFGCKQIVCYDQLESHENIKCEYLSQQCLVCDKLVLASKLSEHQQIRGLCIPCPIKCIIYQNDIEKSIFREHFDECCQKLTNELIEMSSRHRNSVKLISDQSIRANCGEIFLQGVTNKVELVEQEKEMSRLSTNLKFVDAIRQSKEEKLNYFDNFLLILKLILLNWSKA
jgi:hypothetical protein